MDQHCRGSKPKPKCVLQTLIIKNLQVLRNLKKLFFCLKDTYTILRQKIIRIKTKLWVWHAFLFIFFKIPIFLKFGKKNLNCRISAVIVPGPKPFGAWKSFGSRVPLHRWKYGPIPASFWTLFKKATFELSQKSCLATSKM